MEQVWKCDFCRDTNKSIETMEFHEDNCTFNPKNKGCYTCNNCETIYWGGRGEDECIKGHSIFATVDGECNEWEIKL